MEYLFIQTHEYKTGQTGKPLVSDNIFDLLLQNQFTDHLQKDGDIVGSLKEEIERLYVAYAPCIKIYDMRVIEKDWSGDKTFKLVTRDELFKIIDENAQELQKQFVALF